jgi:hypothetical protein
VRRVLLEFRGPEAAQNARRTLTIIKTSWPNVECANDRPTYVGDERLLLRAEDDHLHELRTAAAAGTLLGNAEPPWDPDEAEQ